VEEPSTGTVGRTEYASVSGAAVPSVHIGADVDAHVVVGAQ
jgi:hypothetical protein